MLAEILLVEPDRRAVLPECVHVPLQVVFAQLNFTLDLGQFLLPDPQVIAPQADLTFPGTVLAVHRGMSRCHFLFSIAT